jgi:acylphosphatase
MTLFLLYLDCNRQVWYFDWLERTPMDTGEVKHYSIRVGGRVQGVFFRASTAEKARKLGLKGFVRNEKDGSVYIEAEGPEANVKELIDWAKVGPPHASVAFCNVTEGEVSHYSAFEIQR